MTYDVTENPRFLPSIAELEESKPTLDSTFAARCRERLDIIRPVLNMTKSHAWNDLAATAGHRQRNAQRRALNAGSIEELRRAQGELSMLDWLLELPSSLEREQHNLVAILRRAGEDDESNEVDE